jgi:hypothetical protein
LDLGVDAHGEIGVAEDNQIFEAEPENRNLRREPESRNSRREGSRGCG